jgi:hypothetical protein
MAISVGLIREMEFISTFLKIPVHFTFHLKYNLDIFIKDKKMELKYNNIPIWKENVLPDGMFGLESCDSISRLINAYDNSGDWKKYCYFESV